MTRMAERSTKILDFAREHYENFPVISFLIPKNLRKDVAIIYWFARTADDLADEGEVTQQARLENLARFEMEFNEMLNGSFKSHFWETLYGTVKSKNLTAFLFSDLLSAFRQDVVKNRYSSFPEVLDYCRRSANPVGRLMLELFDIRKEDAFSFSDKICTALQLTNFYQDVLPDYKKGRIYFAQDEMESSGVTEKLFEIRQINDNLKHLVKFNLDRAENLFDEGRKLLPFLTGRFRLEIKWTIDGGLSIIRKIRKNNYNIFIRPHLSKIDFTGILLKSLLK